MFNISRISVISQDTPRTGRRHLKKEPFIVLNSDKNNGLYIKKFTKQIDKLGLVEAADSEISLDAIESKDIVVFGEASDYERYDFRIVESYKDLDDLDNRRFKEKNVFDLVDDFSKVIKKLNKYASANYIDSDALSYVCLGTRKNRRKQQPRTLRTFAVIGKNVDLFDEEEYNPTYLREKATFYYNWVKVGLNRCPIFIDLYGNEFIKHRGNKLFIRKNRYGEQYLSSTPEC